MASDLEALFEHYRRQGLPEEAAAQRAEEKLLASPAALDRLMAVHTSRLQCWFGWLFGRMRRELDLFLFVAGVVPVLGTGGMLLVPQLPHLGGRPFAWAVLGIWGLIGGLAACKVRPLFLKGDVSSVELREGLSTLLFLGWLSPALGACGLLVHLHVLLLELASAPVEEGAWVTAAEQLGRGTSLLGASILLALGAGLLWFILENRCAALERIERALLLGE